MLQVIPIPLDGYVVRKCPICQEITTTKRFLDDPIESKLLICLCSGCFYDYPVHHKDRYQFYDKYGFLLEY